jgi:phospholipid N-methyltransferase
VRYSFRVFERHLRGASILEMGAAEGVMTELLARTGKALTVVEGSSAFCESLARRFPSVQVVHSLFEITRRRRASTTSFLAKCSST